MQVTDARHSLQGAPECRWALCTTEMILRSPQSLDPLVTWASPLPAVSGAPGCRCPGGGLILFLLLGAVFED